MAICSFQCSKLCLIVADIPAGIAVFLFIQQMLPKPYDAKEWNKTDGPCRLAMEKDAFFSADGERVIIKFGLLLSIVLFEGCGKVSTQRDPRSMGLS